MYHATLVYSLLAGLMPVVVLSSPLEPAPEERAPKTCTNSYVNEQLRYCPTATKFCSQFLKTFPPVPTTTKVTKQVSVIRTTTSVTVTPTSFVPLSCEPMTSKRDAEAQPARPTAFGPSCNVQGIEPTKIDNGCSCLVRFTFKGSRPRPTTTATVFSTSTSRTTRVVTKTGSAQVATDTYFAIVPHASGTALDHNVVELFNFGSDTPGSGEGYGYIGVDEADEVQQKNDLFDISPVDSKLRVGSDPFRGTVAIEAPTPGNTLHQLRVEFDESQDQKSTILCDQPTSSCAELQCRFSTGQPAYFFGIYVQGDKLRERIFAGQFSSESAYSQLPGTTHPLQLYGGAPQQPK